MKNFFKKVAFVLALAMVLTNIGPAVSVSAAATPSLKYKSKVLYVGGSVNNKNQGESCWTPSQNNSGYKATYEVTTGKDLITVAGNGKIEVTGAGIGKAVVKVIYTPLKGGQTVTENFTIKVRRNATAVKLRNAVEAVIEEALTIGQKVDLTSAKSWTTPVSWKTGNFGVDNYMAVCSDQIAYKISDDSVIKLEDGKLVAVGAGTATITVYTYEYGDKKQEPTCDKEYPITVIGGIIDVKQTKTTELVVTFASELESISASDFVITQTDSSVVYSIKSVTLSTDKKTVTVETYTEMTDGASFTLKYDEKEYPFTATSGNVAKIVNNRSSVPYGVGTVVSVNLVDANGVVLDTIRNTTYRSDVDFDVEVSNGYMYEDKLWIYEIGKTAKLTVTYRTGEIDSQGNEVGTIKEIFTITATDISEITEVQATVTGNTNCISWSGLSENRTLYVGEGNYIHVLIKDEDGNDITRDYDYYLSSSDENVLIVDATMSHSHSTDFDDDQGIYAEIHGVKEGTANVIVKNTDGKVIKVLPVTVRAEKKYKEFYLNTANLTVSDTTMINDTAEVLVVAKDQYGNEYWPWDGALTDYNANDIVIELVSNNSNGTSPTQTLIWGNSNPRGFEFDGNGATSGTYRYKITYRGVSRYVNVAVKDSSKGSDSYKLVLSNSSIDQAYYDSGNTNSSVEIRVAHLKGGVLYNYLDFNNTNGTYIDSLTVKYGSTTTKVINSSTVSGNMLTGKIENVTYTIKGSVNTEGVYDYPIRTIADTSITNRYGTISGAAVTKSGTGLRSISATVVNDKGQRIAVSSTSFNVSDSQASMTATTNKANLSAADLLLSGGSTIGIMLRNALTFKYNGKTINDNSEDYRIDIVSVKTRSTSTWTPGDTTVNGNTNVASGQQIFVESVTIRYYVRNFNANDSNVFDSPNGGAYVTFTVPVNRTFTINN